MIKFTRIYRLAVCCETIGSHIEGHFALANGRFAQPPARAHAWRGGVDDEIEIRRLLIFFPESCDFDLLLLGFSVD